MFSLVHDKAVEIDRDGIDGNGIVDLGELKRLWGGVTLAGQHCTRVAWQVARVMRVVRVREVRVRAGEGESGKGESEMVKTRARVVRLVSVAIDGSKSGERGE